MKKVIVFGASGGTGKLVVRQALDGGHQVTAVVRNPGVFELRHRNLEITMGDVLQPNTFESALKDQDVIVSCLGVQKTGPTTIYSEGVGNIIKTMQKENIDRIICISAGAVTIPTRSSFIVKFVTKNILQRIFKHIYADMRMMEKALSDTDLNWTIIRPPWLRNTMLTGKYRIAINEHLSNLSKISRADLAQYIANHLTDEKTFKAKIEISY